MQTPYTIEQGTDRGGMVRVSTCQLNQWALDFTGNLERVIESIAIAKAERSRFRTGPELELCGYGCEDHFFENDTIDHCWESLAEILASSLTENILCDIGMPVLFRSIRYNCRVYVLNGQILLIRPKIDLCEDGHYREYRYFSPWRSSDLTLYEMPLNHLATYGIHQSSTKFGLGVIQCLEATIGSESCEELWTLQSPHISMMLDGVDIIANGSSSHHELRKLGKRLELISSATRKGGGAYLYANQIGCDGGRLYYDGSALIAVNGEIIDRAPQFSLKDVTVITATIDIGSIWSFRSRTASLRVQASLSTVHYQRVCVMFSLSSTPDPTSVAILTLQRDRPLATPMEEIQSGPALWLWDYLRRCPGASGFFVPLSGGADSAAVVTIVRFMAVHVCDAMTRDGCLREQVENVTRLNQSDAQFPRTPEMLCRLLLHTCYMGSMNSTRITRELASALAAEIGAYHLSVSIDDVVSAFLAALQLVIQKIPKFLNYGGTNVEDLALQNLQARIRMVFSYLLAQLLPWARNRPGYLLVLGTANVDEALRGYFTKYDCSSADLNPIGSISKVDLKEFLRWSMEHLGCKSLSQIIAARPTAELRPIATSAVENRHSQTDEMDMGLTYAELSLFGKLRQIQRFGPVSMVRYVIQSSYYKSFKEAGQKVKHFFSCYARNRHKMNTLTASYHAESYSPDDNRFDHRQMLYPDFERQYRQIDALVKITPRTFSSD